MRTFHCDLCGKEIGVCFADFSKTTSNELRISTWKEIPRQREQIRCAYDLCDDCAKRINREIANIANNHLWSHGKRPFKWDGQERR